MRSSKGCVTTALLASASLSRLLTHRRVVEGRGLLAQALLWLGSDVGSIERVVMPVNYGGLDVEGHIRLVVNRFFHGVDSKTLTASPH